MNDTAITPRTGPLTGLRVLDLGSFIAGPYGATLMGDMGADVIKIESHHGDETRHYGQKRGDQAGPYLSFNRSKRAIVLDLRRQDAQEVFARIAATSDVFITNMREPALTELGISYERVKVHKPDIIWIRVNSFGHDGPYANRPGLDLLAQAYTGVLALNGHPSGGSVRLGIPAADMLTSLMVVNAALAAVLKRKETGEGQCIDISLIDVMMHAMASTIGPYISAGEMPERTGNRSQYFVPCGVYPTRDGKEVIVTNSTERFFANFCRALETDWNVDPRFHDLAARRKNEDELDRLVANRTRQFDQKELLEKLIAADVLVAPVSTIDEVVNDPQIRHNNMIVTVEHPELGSVDLTGVPIKFHGTPATIKQHPPMLGENTRDILAEFGYEEAQISAMITSGAAADRPELLRRKAERAKAKVRPEG